MYFMSSTVQRARRNTKKGKVVTIRRYIYTERGVSHEEATTRATSEHKKEAKRAEEAGKKEELLLESRSPRFCFSYICLSG